MKQILVLSGKGGTGKTTVAAALIDLFQTKTYADCDVDAPNLHMIVDIPKQLDQQIFYGMDKSGIDPERCTSCGTCYEHCRFGAIRNDGGTYVIEPTLCEGCGVCNYVCPSEAVFDVKAKAGDTMLYHNGSAFSTAKLEMGSGNSGKLVTQVKTNLKVAVNDHKIESDLAIIDGSPGIGCPVIASMSGVNLVLIVTEPSVAGNSDLKRLIDTANHFQVSTAVCVNRFDVNPSITDEIETYCETLQIPFLGRIPYDKTVYQSVKNGVSIIKSGGKAAKSVENIYQKILKMI